MDNEITKLNTRDVITEFAIKLAKVDGITYGDNENCPLTHTFADGIYMREIFMPKGTVCVGKIHKHEHPNFLMQGKVTFVTEDGGMQTIEAPMTMISPAGTQRAVYVHEDTVWVTIHANPTNETDLEKIEDFTIVGSHLELPDNILKEKPCLGS
jgi:hypothetical protein